MRFDAFPGEPTNLDVPLIAHDDRGRSPSAIEAKADDSFGSTVGMVRAAALERREDNARSKGVERIERLITGILGGDPGNLDSCAHLRYQLLTATAATLAAARRHGATRAVPLVHETITDRTTDDRHVMNQRDLQTYMRLVARDETISVAPGTLVGPFRLPGKPIVDSDIPFYVGKAVRNLRSAGV